MLGQTFYHQTIRKYVVLFGTLFNDLNIEKKDSSIVLKVDLLNGQVFGPQPYLAVKTKTERFFHDNLDLIEIGKKWVSGNISAASTTVKVESSSIILFKSAIFIPVI